MSEALDFSELTDDQIVELASGLAREAMLRHPAAALLEAEKFRGVIDVMYIGPASDQKAQAFLRELARKAGGSLHSVDLKIAARLSLSPRIAGLLK